MNKKYLKTGKVRLSNYTLDTFIAPNLSQLKECNAPDLSSLKRKWLNGFILNSIVNLKKPDTKNAHLFNFLRRTEAVFDEYHIALEALKEYVNTDSNVISPYFQALIHFETCISQLYQAALFIKKVLKKDYLYKKDDESFLDRLNKIYNSSKHMDSRIENGDLPELGTCAIWITNDGIECSKSKITFLELRDIMNEFAKLANGIIR